VEAMTDIQREKETALSPINGDRLDVERAASYLGNAVDMHEIKNIRDKAQAIEAYLRAHRAAEVAIQDAAEIVLRADRRLGELCKETKWHDGNPHDTVSPGLKDMGITPKQSSRWQKVAAVPAAKFELYITETRAAEQPVTRSGALRYLQSPESKRAFSLNASAARLERVLDTAMETWPKRYVGDLRAILIGALEKLGGY